MLCASDGLARGKRRIRFSKQKRATERSARPEHGVPCPLRPIRRADHHGRRIGNVHFTREAAAVIRGLELLGVQPGEPLPAPEIDQVDLRKKISQGFRSGMVERCWLAVKPLLQTFHPIPTGDRVTWATKISVDGVDTADGPLVVLVGRSLIKDRAPEVQLDAENG